MKLPLGENLRRFTDCGLLIEGGNVLGHELFNRHGVVKGCVDRPLISIEDVAETHPQNVRVADQSYQLITTDHGNVMHSVLTNELANFGDRIAVVHGDQIAGHDFGNRLVVFHGLKGLG